MEMFPIVIDLKVLSVVYWIENDANIKLTYKNVIPIHF